MLNVQPQVKNEYGRFQLMPAKESQGRSILFIENINHENDFWITLTSETQDKVIGFIKFKRVGPNMFVLDDMRPGLCPIHIESAACIRCAGSQQEASC